MGWGGFRDPLGVDGESTPTQPLRPQARPPDEPKSGLNPIKGEGLSSAARQHLTWRVWAFAGVDDGFCPT